MLSWAPLTFNQPLLGAGVRPPPRAGVIRYAIVKDRAYSVRLCVGTAHGVLLGVALVLWAGSLSGCRSAGLGSRSRGPVCLSLLTVA